MLGQHVLVDLDEAVTEPDRHIKISYKTLGWGAACVLFLTLVAAGACSTYIQMFWKVSNYDQLRADFDRLRGRYQTLQKDQQRQKGQMASLESLASEVSVAYGISQPVSADLRPMDEDNSSSDSLKESIEEFNFLKAASYSRIFHHYAHQFQAHVQPSLWPVSGVLRSAFGSRSDPFSGEGAFHTGIDLSAATGTSVHVTADGVVEATGWSGRYGKLVIVDHGNGIETYYAHLSRFLVVAGQEVRRNEPIGLSGGTGRVTGPHVHYEVRVHGTPVNPYKYLGMKSDHTEVANSARSHNDLGL